MTCNELSPRGYPAVKDAYSKSSAETTMKCTKILYIFMHVYIYIYACRRKKNIVLLSLEYSTVGFVWNKYLGHLSQFVISSGLNSLDEQSQFIYINTVYTIRFSIIRYD